MSEYVLVARFEIVEYERVVCNLSVPYPPRRRQRNFIDRLARGLIHEGIRVTVVVPGAPGAADREQIDGVEIHRVQYWFKKN